MRQYTSKIQNSPMRDFNVGSRRKKGRDVHGIVLLNKTVGVTSNSELQTVKRLFNARKAGHTGSLDPIASGMLPICLGEATKVSAFLLDANKRYRALIKLGVRTNTGDADGEVIATSAVQGINAERLAACLKNFRGEIEQIPPMHSAIKRQGVPLYKLAHQGLEVEREPRIVTIHKLDLLRFEDDVLEVDVLCSKGTYIRTLAEDIGAALGCGAHVSALHRTAVSPFVAEQMVTMEELRSRAEQGFDALDKVLLPIESALADWPDVSLSDDMAHYVRQGQPVFVPRAVTQGWVRLFAGQHRFIGIGQILDDGRVAPRKLLNTDRV
jgi:tRNA pseudouridine55 synthase